MARLPLDIDMSKYVASGIAVFDLTTMDIKWIKSNPIYMIINSHFFWEDFDVTSSSSMYAGYLYSQPTVIDLNGDGKLEIIVGTGVGFIYLLEHDGIIKFFICKWRLKI
jgi:hypothetical protein